MLNTEIHVYREKPTFLEQCFLIVTVNTFTQFEPFLLAQH